MERRQGQAGVFTLDGRFAVINGIAAAANTIAVSETEIHVGGMECNG